MTPPTNSNEAQVAILEARVDGRISSVETTFDNFTKLMEERRRLDDERHRVSETRMDRMEALLVDFRAEVREEIRSLRITILVTAVSSVLTAVLGISALNSSLYSNMLAAMQAGQNMATTAAEVKRMAAETAILLKQKQNEQDKKQSPKPPSSD